MFFTILASLSYEDRLNAMGLPKPELLYPFANSAEYIVNDYSANHFHLTPLNVMFESTTSKYGFPYHAAIVKPVVGSSDFSLSNTALSIASNMANSFTILFHIELLKSVAVDGMETVVTFSDDGSSLSVHVVDNRLVVK